MHVISRTPFIFISIVILSACGGQQGQSSKIQTTPASPQQKATYIQNIENYVRKIPLAKGKDVEEQAWKKNQIQLGIAKNDNYRGHITDAGPDFETFRILKKTTPAKSPSPAPTPLPAPSPIDEQKPPQSLITVPEPEADLDEKVRQYITNDFTGSFEEGAVVEEFLQPETAPPQQAQATDMAPLVAIKNLLCKKQEQCLPFIEGIFEQAVGYYSFRTDLNFGGKLINASQLPASGEGFIVKSNSQDNRWATEHAVQFVQKLGQKIRGTKMAEQLVIGNISTLGGGYMQGQMSHQNGLDVDIGLLYKKGQAYSKENFPKDVVVKDKLTSKFALAENWYLVHMALESNWPLFVLAHPEIKKAFCESAKKSGEIEKYKKVLSRIVPDKGHPDHFHFRLRCPLSSPACVPANYELTATGCD
jgi:penicillin-insensitive murein DD-endopeptidase